MTKCGHTFCYKCISRSLGQCLRCPICNNHLEAGGKDNANPQIFPNYVINHLIAKYKRELDRESDLLANKGTTTTSGRANGILGAGSALAQTWHQLISSAGIYSIRPSINNKTSQNVIVILHFFVCLFSRNRSLFVRSSQSRGREPHAHGFDGEAQTDASGVQL